MALKASANAAFVAGMSGVETMLIFGTDAAMLKFVDGRSVKVGQDFTVVAVSDLGLGNNDSTFNKGDALALSTCNGVTIDWSLTGTADAFSQSELNIMLQLNPEGAVSEFSEDASRKPSHIQHDLVPRHCLKKVIEGARNRPRSSTRMLGHVSVSRIVLGSGGRKQGIRSWPATAMDERLDKC